MSDATPAPAAPDPAPAAAPVPPAAPAVDVPAPVPPRVHRSVKLSAASTKRVLRTVFQLVVSLGVVAPMLLTFLKGTPVEAQVGVFAGVVAAVCTVINKLEDAGLIPAWLKG